MLDAITLLLGFGVVWGLGVSLLAAIAPGDADDLTPGRAAWMVGCGWFVGAFLLTLWMRVLAQIHVPFSIASIGLPLLAATVVLAWRARAFSGIRWRGSWASLTGRELPRWRRAIWLIILGWLAVRFTCFSPRSYEPAVSWDA
jgi:hypothetical protein